MDAKSPGTLYLVATPIGNLEDVSQRALRILREVAVVAAEDTRHTRRLLARHGIRARLVSLHEHNERARTPALLGRLRSGDAIAVVSDAGTPGLSDPGEALVRAAIEAAVPVVPVPGPSAPIAALVASGLPAVPVTFLGFLPAGGAERRRAIEAAGAIPHTLVLFEAPHRLGRTLAALAEAWGDRRAAVARELTKVHEEVYRGRLREALQHFSVHPPRGEITLVVEGAPAPGRRSVERRRQAADDVAADHCVPGAPPDPRALARRMLRRARAGGAPPTAAVREAARATGLRRDEVYRLWLALRQEEQG